MDESLVAKRLWLGFTAKQIQAVELWCQKHGGNFDDFVIKAVGNAIHQAAIDIDFNLNSQEVK